MLLILLHASTVLAQQCDITCEDRQKGVGTTGCVNVLGDEVCASWWNGDCMEGYAGKGMGCAKRCVKLLGEATTKKCNWNKTCAYYTWPDCAGELHTSSTTTTLDERTLPDGTAMYGHCVPKPDLEQSYQAGQAIHCTKWDAINNWRQCTAYQQFCDWEIVFDPSGVKDDLRMTEEQMFTGVPDVLDPLYSYNFGMFPPKKAEGWWVGTGVDGSIREPRKSKWVFWNYDVQAMFDVTGCDCFEDTFAGDVRSEDPEGWFLYNANCNDICKRANAGAEKSNWVTTVHDRVCHREVDIDGVVWDPSPNWNWWTPLSKLFPTRLGPTGLNMKRGEKGASWYWWGKSKPSWNDNDQTSAVGVGEKTFDSEPECRAYAQNYWRSEGYNVEFKSVCTQFSSRTPCTSDEDKVIVSNKTCEAACDKNNTDYDDYFTAQELINADGSPTDDMVPWFQKKCVYTPYQAENDHAWPNFHVPEKNQCFAQWQIGYEDQGCDACMHPEYANTLDFDGGWSYAPVEGSTIKPDRMGHGHCAAQCGKIIMEEKGKPRDVKTAQECQQYCQDDPQCHVWQWRPIADWNKASAASTPAWSGNRFNQVRVCMLKDRAQFEGALKARWDETGKWLWDAKQDFAMYANIYQNLDCGPDPQGANWCLKCEEEILDKEDNPIGKFQQLYHAFKWRNNMISGPKFCDVPQLTHGNADREMSRFWDYEKGTNVPKCPEYPGIGKLRGKPAMQAKYNADGTDADQACLRNPHMDALGDVGDAWAKFCEAADRKNNQLMCEKYQQYCDWNIYYRKSGKEYKAFSDEDLFGAKRDVQQKYYSKYFNTDIATRQGDGSYASDLPDRKEGWVMWHYEAFDQGHLNCDCLEPGCYDTTCDLIAKNADTKQMFFIPDRVCHREGDINGLLYDPAPYNEMEYYEDEWIKGLGMAAGESGASFFWYGVSKPSWNENDQTSYIKEGEIAFETEAECREHAVQYWKDLGFTSFGSVCDMFSSKTIGIDNIDCQYACDGRKPKTLDWFKANCVYTQYHATNDNAWPNTTTADSNDCFSQWQIGYDDQACDACVSLNYDITSEDYDYGWKYKTDSEPAGGRGERDHCDSKCGKIITTGPGKFKDVKTAQECQAYCQADDRCVAFQWRAAPDWNASTAKGGNIINKVRACLLKDVDMFEGAMKARWNSQGKWVGNSDPSWHKGLPDNVPYNEYSQGEWAIKDSQFGKEQKGWYLMCTYDGDSTPTAHSWKWRNNILSGPKYCDAAHDGKIAHGKRRPKSRTYTPKVSDGPRACPKNYKYSATDVAPLPRTVTAPTFPDFTDSPPYEGRPATTSTTTTPREVSTCCDISDNCTSAWPAACESGLYKGCAASCGERNKSAGMTCEKYMDRWCADDPLWCSEECGGKTAPTTTTSSTTTVGNGWDGDLGSCDRTTTSTTTTTTTTTEWVPSQDIGDHLEIPEGTKPSWSDSTNGKPYAPTYIAARDGISSVPGPTVQPTAITPADYCLPGTPGVEGKQYSRDEYFEVMGRMKLGCVGYTEDVHLSHMSVDSSCHAGHDVVYSYANLAKAAGAFPDFLTMFNVEDKYSDKPLLVLQAKLAGYLNNAYAETRGDNVGTGGFCWTTEKAKGHYQCDAKPGNWSYYGRGAFQLTWCTNYQVATNIFKSIGENVDFYTNAEKVLDSWYAFGTGIAFYLNPEPTNQKPSMDYVTQYWTKVDDYTKLPMDNGNRIADVGYLVNVINGGIECTPAGHPSPPIRLAMVRAYLADMGWTGPDAAFDLRGCQNPFNPNRFLFMWDPQDNFLSKADCNF